MPLLFPSRILPIVVVVLLGGWVSGALHAADPAFVGALALAAESEVAQQLGLSSDAQKQLIELIDRREREALDLALELRELPPSEREARLAPFVAESERLGLALLNPLQRERLKQLQVARAGLAALGEARLAETLKLTAEQQQQVQKLLEARQAEMSKGGERERKVARDVYERRLAEVLTSEQRVAWEQLAGLAGPPGTVTAAPAPAPASDSTVAKPSEPSSAPPARTNPPAAEPDRALADSLPPGDVKLRFNFNYAPWKDVLEWFAQQAGLSLQIDSPPPGTFNYKDTRTFTPAEGIDVLNSVLLTKGYTLLRRGRMLTLINLEDKVPDVLVELTPLEDLEERGEFELTKTMFSLRKITAEVAEPEIRKLIGPQGSLVPFPSSRQVLVTETGGKLRAIRDMIARMEDPMAIQDQKVTEIVLKHATAEDVLEIARPLLSIPDGQTIATDIRIAVDPFGMRLFATGTPEMIARLQEIVPLVDKDPSGGGPVSARPLEQPQLETYFIKAADPSMALKVISTILAGLPDVRLDVDATSGKLIALARPSEHRTIQATLQMLEGQVTQFDTIQLRRTDPQVAILTINKFFGLDKGAADAPIVDGDTAAMKLWVRGTPTQIAQIRDLIETLEGGAGGPDVRSTMRMIPLTGPHAESVLEQAERLWTGSNRIRVVTPSAISPSIIQQRAVVPPPASAPRSTVPGEAPPREAPPPDETRRRTPPESRAPLSRWEPDRPGKRSPFLLVSERVLAEPAAPEPANPEPANPERANPEPANPEPANPEPAAGDGADAERGAGASGGEIRVTVTPNGLLITSDDVEALDQFERLVRSLSGPMSSASFRDYTIFYLKFAKAEVAQQLIQDILGGSSSSSSGGGSLLGDMASNMFGGGLLGGLMGGMMGGGGGGEESATTTVVASEPMRIISDPRLNALIVYGNAQDQAMIEQLLKVIDREGSMTDVQTDGVPRLIPVVYSSADEVAEVVKQVFANRMAASGGASSQQNRQPSPEDFIRALRGGSSRGRGSEQSRGEPARMTVGVDRRSNSLIVTAPEPLFQEVELLVRQIDQEGTESSQAMSVFTFKSANPELVQKALSSLLGTSTTTSRSSSSGSSSSSAPSPAPGGGPSNDDIQRRMEFFQRLRDSGAFGGGGGGGPPSFGGRSSGGGGGGPPGFGGGGDSRSFGRGDGGRGGSDRSRGR